MVFQIVAAVACNCSINKRMKFHFVARLQLQATVATACRISDTTPSKIIFFEFDFAGTIA